MVLLTFFLWSFKGDVKNEIPKGYFIKPIEGTMRLSGTFGELRPNHFHSGIDIKPTIGSSGQKVLAAADGYIFRIKVESGGYGNALYVKHPNGYITVYAHLDRFNSEIEKYVREYQYKKKDFNVNIYPGPGVFDYKQGEEIARLGNTGGSGGPHLHFEIRKGDLPMNPLLFELPFTDNVKPRMYELKVYHLNEEKETLESEDYKLQSKNNIYVPGKDTLIIGAWRVGLGLKVYDHMTGVTNWNGIYRLNMYVNDTLAYSFSMDEFAFYETRFLNAHLDYKEQVKNKAYYNRCYLMPGNKLSIYNENPDGVINLFKDKPTKIRLVAEDANGNEAESKFFLKRGEVLPLKSKPFNYKLAYDKDEKIEFNDFFASFEAGTFYENCYLNYSRVDASSENQFSSSFILGEYTTPVHKYFDLAIQPIREIPENLKSKVYISYCDKNHEINNCGGYWSGNFLKTSVRQLGEYSIHMDTIPPSIRPINFKANMKSQKSFSFKIKDETPTIGKAKGLNFVASVDGNWILMEYDRKNDKITHHFENEIQPGNHTFRLEVFDDRGNKSLWKSEFSN
jgi:hypothetical protein